MTEIRSKMFKQILLLFKNQLIFLLPDILVFFSVSMYLCSYRGSNASGFCSSVIASTVISSQLQFYAISHYSAKYENSC